MKSYILVLVVLFSLAPPAMAANLTADQISYTEMWVNGTGFTGAEVTLSTTTSIPVTPSGGAYSYEITGIYLPAGSVLKLDASPVNDDLKLYVKKYWPFAWTFDRSYGSIINYKYTASTKNVHVHRSVPDSWIAGTFQTIRVYGTTENSSVNLSVMVEQSGVDVNPDGTFSKGVNINGIPTGNYTISATDGTNTATTNVTIYGLLYRIAITEPDTSELTLNTTNDYPFEATGYDIEGTKVGHVTFTWTSSSTYIGTIDYYTGYFNATNVGHTEVYARSGTKESNHVTVYVNAPVNNTTWSSDDSFTLESGNANVTGIFDDPVNGSATLEPIGNVTAATTVGLGVGYVFTSGAIVNVSGEAHTALEEGNGTVTIKLCVNDSELRAMGLARSNVQIYVYDDSAGKWVGLTTTRVGTTDCYTADISVYLSEVTVGIGSKPAPTPSGGGGGGDGTYPPGWFGTPTPTPTATPTVTPQPGVAPTPAGWQVTPTPAKPAAAGATPTAPAKEKPTKKGIPGFTAVFAIAGMLAIAYVVMRRRR